LVWSPKYRKHILTGVLRERVEQMFREIAEVYDITIDEMEVSPDHAHLLKDGSTASSKSALTRPRAGA
jgi:putative transposase